MFQWKFLFWNMRWQKESFLKYQNIQILRIRWMHQTSSLIILSIFVWKNILEKQQSLLLIEISSSNTGSMREHVASIIKEKWNLRELILRNTVIDIQRNKLSQCLILQDTWNSMNVSHRLSAVENRKPYRYLQNRLRRIGKRRILSLIHITTKEL